MTSWQQIFVRPKNSGVYTAEQDSIPDICRAAAEKGLVLFRVDAAGIKGKQEFINAVARILQYPEYFGFNWDAFEDCLTDLSWQQANGYLLLLENLEDFAFNAPEEMKIARSIFRDASSYWKEQGIRFFVILAERNEPPESVSPEE
jgi:hypothetical protein